MWLWKSYLITNFTNMAELILLIVNKKLFKFSNKFRNIFAKLQQNYKKNDAI